MNDAAKRRVFLEAAQALVKTRQPSAPLICTTLLALEHLVNDMTDEPMRLLLVTEAEAEKVKELLK